MKDKQSRSHRSAVLWRVLFTIAVLCGLQAPPALAAAIYLGRSTAELTITEITGGNTVGTACSVCTAGDAFFVGNASASSTGFANVNAAGGDPTNLAVGDGLSLKAEASGSASAIGSADSFFNAVASVALTNSGPSTITVTFRLVWSLFADASIDAPVIEDALAFADIIVEIGSSPDLLVEEEVISDALFGPFGPQSLSDDLTFTLTLAPNGSDFVDIALFAEGFADALAAIPEPGIVPLFALGLAGLGFFVRRRRA